MPIAVSFHFLTEYKYSQQIDGRREEIFLRAKLLLLQFSSPLMMTTTTTACRLTHVLPTDFLKTPNFRRFSDLIDEFARQLMKIIHYKIINKLRLLDYEFILLKKATDTEQLMNTIGSHSVFCLCIAAQLLWLWKHPCGCLLARKHEN